MRIQMRFEPAVNTEVFNATQRALARLADAIPENTYYGFSIYTVIAPLILKEFAKVALPEAQGVTGPVWNYIDSACSVLVGLNQLQDNETHRPAATKIKGVVNILNGVQLTTLTAVSFTMLGGPGFAAAFGVGFAISLDDAIHARRKWQDEKYWFEDALAELEKISQIIDDNVLPREIRVMEEAMKQNNITSRAAHWALNQKKERLQDLKETKRTLEEDILTRAIEMRNQDFNKDKDTQNNYQFMMKKIPETPNNNLRSFYSNLHTKINLSREEIRAKCTTPAHRNSLKKIDQRNEANYESAIKDSAIWGLAFAGMLLCCIPGCQIWGLAVVGVASALYLHKNYKRIKGFFSKKEAPNDLPTPPISTGRLDLK